ncbi:MAG: hypothetical protein JXB32_19375 [Deltaproteobacteria bacterium]|nr:hypothetical protein [Deltaproteobacteria bacterium]
MTEFKAAGDATTGPSGGILLVPGPGSSATDRCNATLAGYAAVSAVSCGTRPYRASIQTIVMVAE